MESKELERLKERILEFLKDANIKIILFGSRARKENIISSDVDIGIIPKGRFDKKN